VCLYFKNQIKSIVELNNAGVIYKDRKTKIFSAFGLAYFFGGTLDISFKK